MVDRDLTHALTAKAQGFRERVPVYPVTTPPSDQQLRRASILAGTVWDFRGDCGPRLTSGGGAGTSTLILSEGRRVNVYNASGAIDASTVEASSQSIAQDERKVDRPTIYKKLRGIAEKLAKHFVADDEELRPESVWETKGRGITLRRQESPVALFECVAAFRRYINGLPVLGRATIHVGIAGARELTKWGVDWRDRGPRALTEAAVIDPSEAASRISAELQTRRPGSRVTLEDYEPENVSLGYLAMARRVDQRVLQPVWVAKLRPRRSSMGVVIAVPASAAPYESIALPARTK